jgi:hypothetical protein
MTDTVLIVPGLGNSGPVHWQSLWQVKHPEYVRVSQRDWEAPRVDDWAEPLDRAIREAQGRVFIVAHSFGCLAAIRRLEQRSGDVSGALLVAPADPAKWAPALSLQELPIPTTLVASRNDPWIPLGKAHHVARQLGSSFVNAGEAGHINTESGYGPWSEGERLLAKLMATSAARERALAIGLALGA